MNKNDALIKTYTELRKNLQTIYQWKVKTAKYIGPAIISNFVVTILFISFSTFLTIDFKLSVSLFTLSIILTLWIPKLVSKRKTINFTFNEDGDLTDGSISQK